jgi:hypothetical protein
VIASIPATLVLLTQQLFSLDLIGALNTIQIALVGGFLAVFLPIIESRALIQERQAAILGALAIAGPAALLGAGAAIVEAINAVLEVRSSVVSRSLMPSCPWTSATSSPRWSMPPRLLRFVRHSRPDSRRRNRVRAQTIAEALAARPPAPWPSQPPN